MTKILLVDDEEFVVQTLATALRRAGYDVNTASDGDRGLEEFNLNRPDLVITDIIMPNREGIGLIQDLRRRDPEIPILALSGGGRSRNFDFLDLARRLGATETLRKPVRLADFVAAVKRCLATKGGEMSS